MTTEQLNRYEELKNDVECADFNLTASILEYATMSKKEDEHGFMYISRLENQHDRVSEMRKAYDKVRADLDAFIRTL